MLKSIIRTAAMAASLSAGSAVAQERIRITSDWGDVVAELADNATTRRLVQMVPLTLPMRDHLRQEKTGRLPEPLPSADRQVDFAVGTLGLWGSGDFVIYYRSGRVPPPGIIVLGRIRGDASIFDQPGSVTVRLERGE
jgi:hypothetical protein